MSKIRQYENEYGKLLNDINKALYREEREEIPKKIPPLINRYSKLQNAIYGEINVIQRSITTDTQKFEIKAIDGNARAAKMTAQIIFAKIDDLYKATTLSDKITDLYYELKRYK